ncbi:hypothetical protein NQ314_008507 [Rhamnusium bicolor]|uniref:Gustatory receptor n=1 Tax=Rhamnusium bicolor TaxID=1586634 RepID=A0AAV8Y984_9CUCU|nr:hypothetical protein NQ314_008507 [Rhamnusium bicolor]
MKLFWPIVIIFCCDMVINESSKLITMCYKLEQNLPFFSEERQELESLRNQAIVKCPNFTAAGLISIKRSTLLAILGTTTTYFIVIIQFTSLNI